MATVIDGFEDTDTATRFDGQRAALVQVYRVGERGCPRGGRGHQELRGGSRSRLPAGVSVATWDDDSIILKQRIGLLLRNARLGLILVFLCLTLFLNLRLAFWTTMGIPISFLGGFWLIPHVRCHHQHDLAVRLHRRARHRGGRRHRGRREHLRVPAAAG